MICCKAETVLLAEENAGWLALNWAGWQSTPPRMRRRCLGLGMHLALQVILDTDLFDQVELRFQPINMLFSIFQNFIE